MSPIQNRIIGVFVPVSDIHKAGAWYSRILGLPADGEVLFGHIYCPKMEGTTGLILDSKAPKNRSEAPLFMFKTADVVAAYKFMLDNGVELLTEIENGHWFNFRDPDGNVMMVCQ